MVVRPRKGSAAVCSRCHQRAVGYDQLAERRFEFIPLWGFFVFLLYAMRRVNCRRCGVVAAEEVPWGDGKRTLTKAYMLFLARWARHLSWKETAESRRWARLTIAATISRSRISSVPATSGTFSCRCVLKNSAGSWRPIPGARLRPTCRTAL